MGSALQCRVRLVPAGAIDGLPHRDAARGNHRTDLGPSGPGEEPDFPSWFSDEDRAVSRGATHTYTQAYTSPATGEGWGDTNKWVGVPEGRQEANPYLPNCRESVRGAEHSQLRVPRPPSLCGHQPSRRGGRH